ncbi:NAD(P)-binding protein [Pseudooceanicola sp. HF7]|uniref:NAD(P)-binding protein n=1 Tax=Pseudooceanicola sp. HF7 TaxID=2721560 RepID=UPI00143161D3|nr:NAD(P)-binding protein [Pseudooceanicola sp. HF7]NIZ08464.1 FAD-dependent oxidoreductase [Pseudooceanicola sp. HF7]
MTQIAPKIAIVGAGPSGCYLAQALLKAVPGAEIDMLDRLPVPFGLVRYGVAADHQGTKAVARQFSRLFEKQGVRFFGNVTLGQDGEEGTIALTELQEAYDVVALGLGLPRDRALPLPGGDLPGVIGAGALTRHWNDHPDDAADLPDLGRRVVIVGQGNVAIDVLRILAKREEHFEGSDLSHRHTDHIAAAGIESIDIFGRSPAHEAKFDPVMVKELAQLPHMGFAFEGLHHSDGREDTRLEALASLPAAGDHDIRVTFHFGATPVKLCSDAGRVASARFACGGEELSLPCDTVISAIGFETHVPGIRDDLLAGAEDADLGVIRPGLYATGWFARGPRGTIPENRQAAQALAKRIAADLGTLPTGEKPGSAALLTRCPETTDYQGWQRIDAAETAACAEGRVRAKVADLSQMLTLAKGQPETDS